MTHLSMPTSSAFFRGQIAAQKGMPAPSAPSANASFQDKLFYRGYMTEIKKVQPTNDSMGLASLA